MGEAEARAKLSLQQALCFGEDLGVAVRDLMP